MCPDAPPVSFCMFLFGLITILQGFTQNLSGLIAARFFLGIVETGVFPACFYLIAMWYKREEAQKRYSFFFSSTTLAGGFGGLLASAIGKMDGLHGYRGWRWIFILGKLDPSPLLLYSDVSITYLRRQRVLRLSSFRSSCILRSRTSPRRLNG